MKNFAVFIHTVDGEETVAGILEAASEQEILDRIYKGDYFYDFSHQRNFYRIKLSHITKVRIVERT